MDKHTDGQIDEDVDDRQRSVWTDREVDEGMDGRRLMEGTDGGTG